MAGIAPKIPLNVDEENGFTLLKTIREVGQQNLKNLLLTAPGERMMNPDFGVGLRRYLFEHDGFEVRGRIITRINDQVAQYLPFLEIKDIVFEPTMDLGRQDMDNNTLKLSVAYIILPLAIEDILQINVNSSIY